MNTLVRSVTPLPPESSSVRRIVLPSGKEIEVVHFAAPAAPRPPAHELTICPNCEGDHIQLVDWQGAGHDHWRLDLHCPNCGWQGGGVFSHTVVEAFEAQLDRATDALVADLRRLEQARMQDDIERFSRALAGDHLLPEDF